MSRHTSTSMPTAHKDPHTDFAQASALCVYACVDVPYIAPNSYQTISLSFALVTCREILFLSPHAYMSPVPYSVSAATLPEGCRTLSTSDLTIIKVGPCM